MTLHNSSSYIKADARGSLTGHYGVAIVANVLYAIASLALSELATTLIPGTGMVSSILLEVAAFLATVLSGILLYGLYYIYLNLQFEQPVTLWDLFRGFMENTDKIAVISAVLAAINTLSMLPANLTMSATAAEALVSSAPVLISLYVAGYIVSTLLSLFFAPSLFILLDYPDLSAIDVLKKSITLMKGNKLRFLYLSLSFIPLLLVGFLSCGIANLWVICYQYAAYAAFYKDLVSGRKSLTRQTYEQTDDHLGGQA